MVVKKLLSSICIGALLINIFIGCSNEQSKFNTKESAQQSVDHLENTKEITPFSFNYEDTSTSGKPILQKTFNEINEEFGQYKEIKYYKTDVPASPNIFNYWGLVEYEDGEFLFSVGEHEKEIHNECKVNKFFITGDKYSLKCGLSIGMSTDEVIDKFKNAERFHLKDTDNYLLEMNVLNRHMPKGYYFGYKEAIYLHGEVTEEEQVKYDKGGMTRRLGIVLLIKDDKVNGIIMDYPTAN